MATRHIQGRDGKMAGSTSDQALTGPTSHATIGAINAPTGTTEGTATEWAATLGINTSNNIDDLTETLAAAVTARENAANRAHDNDGPYGPARHTGNKYTGYRDAKEIAKDIRADIKNLKAAGAIPQDVKVSVRKDSFTGGQAIDVTLSGWPADRVYVDTVDHHGLPSRELSDEAQEILDTVEAAREAYNRDTSDPMYDYFNVTYYGTTEWDWRL